MSFTLALRRAIAEEALDREAHTGDSDPIPTKAGKRTRDFDYFFIAKAMKANFQFLKICALAAFILLGLGFRERLQAQTDGYKLLADVAYFGVDTLNGEGEYRFYPIKKDTTFLSSIEEGQYSYVWDFGDGRYSLEATPTMRFDHNPPKYVSLRVTGLKTIKDPDAKTAGPLIRSASSNCMAYDTIIGVVNLKTKDVVHPRVPEVRILQPSSPPVAGMCSDYLVEFDFAEHCTHHGEFQLAGAVEGLGTGPLWKIVSFESSPELQITMNDRSNALSIKTDRTQAKKLYLLMHCQFDPKVDRLDIFHWKLTGNFKPGIRTQSCQVVPIDLDHRDQFQSSFDPSSLRCAAPDRVQNGELVEWEIMVQNQGNASEGWIEVIDTLPSEFDWNSLEIISVQWAGKDFTATPALDTLHHVLHWTMSNAMDPLQPGEYVQIQFRAKAAYDFACPDMIPVGQECSTRPTTGHLVKHMATVTFDGDRVDGKPRIHLLEYNDLQILCSFACKPKPVPAPPYVPVKWVPIAVAVSILAALATIIYLIIVLTRVKKTLKLVRSRQADIRAQTQGKLHKA